MDNFFEKALEFLNHYKFFKDKEIKCKENIREDKIKAVIEGKEFKYDDKRHNPRYGTTGDGGPR